LFERILFMANANCSSLNNAFTQSAIRISPEIQQRTYGKNLIVDKAPHGVWPDGLSDTVNVLTVERSITTGTNDGDAWDAVIPTNAGDNASCLPTTVGLASGQTQRQMSITRRAIQSDDICLELLRNDFEIGRQLDITFNGMSQALQWELEKNAINQYIWNSSSLINCQPNGFSAIKTGAQYFDTVTPPTSILTQGFLDEIYDQYVRDTNGEGSVGQVDAAYVYGLVTEQTTSRSLIRDNADIRQDIRYAFTGDKLESELLKPYGVGRSFGNFAHVVCNHMPRFDYVNGAYVRRNFYDGTVSTTKGVAPRINPLYLAAEYTTSFIWNPYVWKMLVPGEINAPGGNTQFTTPNYFPAQFKWLNIPDKVCNPDGTIGFFRAVAAMAAMPLHPEYGWVILHQRAIPPQNFQNYT
jgi:hypothetical protein